MWHTPVLGKKSTWKRPVVNHMDITPAFNYSFNVWICTLCHRHGANSHSRCGAVYKYGIWERSCFFIFRNTSQMAAKTRGPGTIYLTFPHFECVALRSFPACSYSNVRICFFIHLKFKIYKNMIYFFLHSFWTSLNECNISSWTTCRSKRFGSGYF